MTKNETQAHFRDDALRRTPRARRRPRLSAASRVEPPAGALGKAWAIELIKDAARVTNKQAEASYKALLEGVASSVAKGERVTFQGFGTFEKTRAARAGVNPQTGAPIQIPATEAPGVQGGRRVQAARQGQVRKKAAKSAGTRINNVIRIRYLLVREKRPSRWSPPRHGSVGGPLLVDAADGGARARARAHERGMRSGFAFPPVTSRDARRGVRGFRRDLAARARNSRRYARRRAPPPDPPRRDASERLETRGARAGTERRGRGRSSERRGLQRRSRRGASGSRARRRAFRLRGETSTRER